MSAKHIRTKCMGIALAAMSTLAPVGLVHVPVAEAASGFVSNHTLYGVFVTGMNQLQSTKVTDIKGSFQVMSLSYGAHATLSAPSGSQDRRKIVTSLQPIDFVKRMDGESAHIWSAMLSGKEVTGAIAIEATIKQQVIVVMELKFQGTIVSDQETVSDGSVGQEEIMIAPVSETFTFTPTGSDGKSTTVTYDISKIKG